MCAALVPASGSPVQAGGEIAGVASVIDGDTIEIHGQRIRLHGIDAPESSQTCLDAGRRTWRCGQRAALSLRRSSTCGVPSLPCRLIALSLSGGGHVWTAPRAQGDSLVWHAGRVRSCVRPVCAVLVTAGPDEVRGPGPNQFSALEARPDPHGVARSRRSTVVPSPPKSPCLVAHHMTDGLMRRAGTLRPAPGAPRRCAPSCWPARRPRPCAASRAAAGRATGLSLQDCARPAAARPARR
jgi:hypothetical protein